MKVGNWRAIAELVGVAAIVTSLFFVGLQLRQSQDIALSELDVGLNSMAVDLAAVIGDNVEVWTRGNAGQELSDSEKAIYSLLIDGVEGRYRSAYRRNIRFGREDVAKGNAAAFAIFLHRNPGAQRTWAASEEIRAEDYRTLGLPFGGEAFLFDVRADLEMLAASGR